MKTIPVVTLALIASGLMFTPAWAKPSPRLNFEHGVITSVDPTAHQLVIKEHQNADQTFRWTNHTRFVRGKESATYAELKPGERVRVGFKPGTDPLTARLLDLLPARGLHHHAMSAR